MARLRNVLIDNTEGKIYTLVAGPTPEDTTKYLAPQPRTAVAEIKPAGVAVQVVQDTNGWTTAAAGTLTSFTASVRAADTEDATPGTPGITVRLRRQRGSTTNTVGSWTIDGDTESVSVPLNYQFIAGDRFFIDVLAIGLQRTGRGLYIQMGYYQGQING